MDQLRFNIIANTFGTSKVDELRQRLGLVGNEAIASGSKLTKAAAGTYIFTKAVELGRTALNSFKEVIDMADDLNDLVEVTGASAKHLSAFASAAKISGVSTEALEKNIKKLSANLGDPNNEKFKDALSAIGISALDANGKLKDSGQMMLDISNKFAAMEDGPKKAALANNLFGKSGSDLIPMLNMGGQAIDKLAFKMANEFPARAARFNDSLAETKKLFQQQQAGLLNDFLPEFQGAIDSWNAIQKADKVGFGTVGKDLGYLAKGSLGVINSVITRVISLGDILGTVIIDIFSGISMVVKEIMTTLGSITRAVTSIMTGDFKNALSGFSYVGDAAKQDALDRRQRYSSMWERVEQRGINEELYWNLFNSGYEEQQPRAPKKKTAVDYTVPDKKVEKESLALAKYAMAQSQSINLEREKIENYALSETELKKLTIAQELQSKAVQDTIGWEKSTRDAYMATTEAVIAQKQALVDMEQQQKRSFTVGAKQAMNEYLDRMQDVASQTKDMFLDAFQNMEDALVEFVKTGTMNFQKFADAIITDLIRIAVRQATLGILVSAGVSSVSTATASGGGTGSGYLGANTSFSANGNIVSKSGVMPLSRFAKGGVVNSPHVAVFGEAGPEAFVPLPDGRRIPVSLEGATGGSGDVNVVVHVNMDSGKTEVTGKQEGQALGTAISGVVKAEIVNQMRPGGVLYRR